MPSKNTVKTYVDEGYYHIYNRGVEKRTIFVDEQDYKVFLKYLKEYLSKPPDLKQLKTAFTLQGSTFKGVPRQPSNFFKKVELVAFCLMPNHFHLLIKVIEKNDLKRFMQSLSTRFTVYFNKKYKRVGPLFQGIYKATLITDDSYLLHLSRYIHLNPGEYTKNLTSAYSSYPDYLGLRKISWLKPEIVLDFFNAKVGEEFKKTNNYKDFVEKYEQDSGILLGELTLENES